MKNSLNQFLENPLSFFSKFQKKTDSVIGIDIGSSFLKVVQLKKKRGKAILETYGELALGPYADLELGRATNLPVNKIIEALNDLFKEANITTKSGALSLPLSSSLLSMIEMPALDNKQLAKMIPVEARKHIPVPITEVSLDWWVIPKQENINNDNIDDVEKQNKRNRNKRKPLSKVDVLIVAIHNDAVSKYQKIIEMMELSHSFLELEVFSTSRSTFGSHASPVMVLDIGAGSSKLSIVEYGIIKKQHIINKGSQDITIAISKSLDVDIKKAEQLKKDIGLSNSDSSEMSKKVSATAQLIVEYILSETSRVLLNYQRTQNKVVGQVILSGGGALLKGLYDFAENKLETEVVFADPFSKVEAPAFLEPVLKDAGPEFAVAVGLALRKLQEIN